MNNLLKKEDVQNNRSEINILKKSLLNFKFQKSTGQLEKTSEIRKIREYLLELDKQKSDEKSDEKAT